MATFCLHIQDFSLWAVSRHACGAGLLVVYAAGKVVSCSPLLQAAGVGQGDPVERVRGLFPQATLVPRDLSLERMALVELLDRLHAHTPRLVRLQERELPGVWVLLARLYRAEFEDLVAQLQGRGGIAADRSTALLAAAAASPSRVRVVSPQEYAAFLAQTPAVVLSLLGFSEYCTDSLRLLGLKTLKACAALTRRQLAARFDREGERLFALLHGHHPACIPAFEPRSLTCRYDFDWPVTQPDPVALCVRHLLDQALQELGSRQVESLSLTLTTRERRVLKGIRILREPTRRREALAEHLCVLLAEIFTEEQEISRVEVSLLGLSPDRESQMDLFAGRRGVLGNLERALGNATRRFAGKVFRPVFLSENAPFPEDAFRLDPLYKDGETIRPAAAGLPEKAPRPEESALQELVDRACAGPVRGSIGSCCPDW
ncbi:MAG: hypothetical protein AB1505_12485 [Candidatus Latescibacterota bacterium]